MATSKHKRGDTFDRSGTINVLQNGLPLLDLTGWMGVSQMRNARDVLVVQFAFEWLDASRSLVRLSAPEGTDTWPLGEALIDIQLTAPGGTVVSTNTMVLDVVKDVSRV